MKDDVKLKIMAKKIYFETYAKVCLNDLFNLNLILRTERYKTDRPDLISDDEKIGIEVTQGFSQERCKLNKLFSCEYDTKEKE